MALLAQNCDVVLGGTKMFEREKFFAKARDNDGRSADAIVVAYATLKSRLLQSPSRGRWMSRLTSRPPARTVRTTIELR